MKKKGGKKNNNNNKGGKGNYDRQKQKQQERQTKRNIQREKKRRQYGDADWVREFDLFLAQLKLIGLTIKDVAGDGNCLFRAIADQMEGNPNNHANYRKRICEYIENHRLDFEPFVEDDEPFVEYIARMKRNGIWGGQLEIQACSLALGVNITIHQLNLPRWDVVNLSEVKTIHLSYHQGQHYSSVRKIGDVINVRNVVPSEIKIVDSSKHTPTKEIEKKPVITPEEKMVMEFSGCQNREFVRKLLIENWDDVNATVEFIIMVGPNNTEFQKDYLEENGFNPVKNSIKTTTKAKTTTTTTTTTTTKTNSKKINEPEVSVDNKNIEKNEIKEDRKKNNEHDKENQQPFIHPKLQKYYNAENLSNKDRKEKIRAEKVAPEKTAINNSEITVTTPGEVVDVSVIAQDLGSMLI